MAPTGRPARIVMALAALASLVACGDAGSGGSADPAYVETVRYLADHGDGRDNGTEGSARARDRIADELAEIAEPIPGGDGYLHPFDEGTNVLGVIQGTGTSGEVVVLGAHYDHLGHDCPTADPGDEVCDGAGDNASGVATVLELGRRLAADPPTRSVVLALWDAEEDDKLGSLAAVESGVIDTGTVVAYLNWDMQGIDLLPSLADTTLVVGAETGGPALEDAVAAGTGATDLRPVDLSLLFGQGRSDHATFADEGVPVVFFTDGTSGCYHTSQDDMDHLDTGKLGRQIDMGEDVVRELAGAGPRPAPVAGTPAVSFTDAQGMLAVLERAEPNLDRLASGDQADLEQFRTALDGIVQDGEAAFGEDDAGTLLAGAAELIESLAASECRAD